MGIKVRGFGPLATAIKIVMGILFVSALLFVAAELGGGGPLFGIPDLTGGVGRSIGNLWGGLGK